jgi:lysophospholipase L1-like esterase
LSQWLPVQDLPNTQLWLNQGISGDTTTGILQRLSFFADTHPESVYLMAGINDLRRGSSDREVLANLRQIMTTLRVQHPETQIFVQSLLPNSIGISNTRIRNLNRQVAQIARQEGVGYLDLYSQFADENGGMIADFTTDGLHLNDRGYAVWQAVLRDMQNWVALNSPTRTATAF